MSGHCKNCACWEEYEAPPKSSRYQGERKLGFGGICKRATSDNSAPVSSGTLALAMDRESYYAELHTSPIFGCIQFEEVMRG